MPRANNAWIIALFARGIVARTGELSVRYRSPVRIAEPVTVVAKYCGGMSPLHRLEAEIRQAGHLCAKATGKFMAVAT